MFRQLAAAVPLQNEVRRVQRVLALEHDAEVGGAVAVGVARDDRRAIAVAVLAEAVDQFAA